MANKKNNAVSAQLNAAPEIPATVMSHINFLADKMIGTSNLAKCDRDDLVQEMCLAVVKAMSTYRKSESSPKGTRYLNRAADITADAIYRYRISRGLDTPAVSIEANMEAEENGEPFVELPAGDDADRQSFLFDIRVIVAGMPDDLGMICRLIMDGYNFSEIARMMNVSEATIRTRRLEQIRRIFIAHGIISSIF